MAERKAGVSFETIMRDLQARKFSPIYILMGEESYYIDRIADYIADHVMPVEERDFNQNIFFGADIQGAQLVDVAKEYPMMAQHRVVIVKEAQGLKGWDALEKYIEKPVPTTILVICHKNGSIDRRKKIVAKAEATGIVFESKKKREGELYPFIENYMKQHGATIDQKAAMMMADHIGADLSRLASELDKLLLSMSGDDRRVTPDMVEQRIGVSKEYNIFELRNAIVNRDILKANRIVNYFDKNPKSGGLYVVLPSVFNFFQNLMAAFYAPDRMSGEGVARHLELKSSWQARDYLTAMRNYTAMKTLQIISKIREIDAKSKGLDNPNTPSGELMKELIFFILH